MIQPLAQVPRGFSILEMVIVSGLFFGLLALVSAFVVKGKRIAVRTETLASVQHEATKLVRALSQDLGRGTMETPKWSVGSLIFLSSKPVDRSAEPELEFDASSGKVLWKSWVGYHLDPADGKVRRFVSPLATPVAEPIDAPNEWDLTDLPGLDLSTGRIVAKQIIEFVPEGAPSADYIRYRVRARGEVPLGNLSAVEKTVEVELSTTVRLGTVFRP